MFRPDVGPLSEQTKYSSFLLESASSLESRAKCHDLFVSIETNGTRIEVHTFTFCVVSGSGRERRRFLYSIPRN